MYVSCVHLCVCVCELNINVKVVCTTLYKHIQILFTLFKTLLFVMWCGENDKSHKECLNVFYWRNETKKYLKCTPGIESIYKMSCCAICIHAQYSKIKEESDFHHIHHSVFFLFCFVLVSECLATRKIIWVSGPWIWLHCNWRFFFFDKLCMYLVALRKGDTTTILHEFMYYRDR